MRDVKKLYYSISEVSEITGLKQYVLRYWETEFKQLNPKKNTAGNRIYKSHDIETITKIKNLLYDRKYTIKGAQQYFKSSTENNKSVENADKIIKFTNELDVNSLKELKQNLNELIKVVENYKD